eukprot:scaffold1900_cov123-Cylindrotheca_fusiformis.AAC.29
MTESKSDPLYADLMTPANGDLPLHNYYSEFRLGQGDPLMKAAMKQWPCTTTEDEEPPVANKTETPKPDNGKRCNVVGFPAPSAVAAPLQTPSTLLCNTVGQE